LRKNFSRFFFDLSPTVKGPLQLAHVGHAFQQAAAALLGRNREVLISVPSNGLSATTKHQRHQFRW
jgi:hypothetical protein